MTFRMTILSYAAIDFRVAARALPGQSTSGDLRGVIPRPRAAIVAVADGLGHGYEAAIAPRVAINSLVRTLPSGTVSCWRYSSCLIEY